MQKIQELVKEGKLSESLMADKEFVEGAKEIFKSEKIDIDDKKLAKLMDEIEAQLEKSDILDDKKLEQVSGGGKENTVIRGIVKTVTTVVGLYVGTQVGAVSGVAAGGLAGGLTGALTAHGGSGSSEIGMGIGGAIGAGAGAVGGAVGGFGVGGVLGYKFGNWICKKAGLNED